MMMMTLQSFSQTDTDICLDKIVAKEIVTELIQLDSLKVYSKSLYHQYLEADTIIKKQQNIICNLQMVDSIAEEEIVQIWALYDSEKAKFEKAKKRSKIKNKIILGTGMAIVGILIFK